MLTILPFSRFAQVSVVRFALVCVLLAALLFTLVHIGAVHTAGSGPLAQPQHLSTALITPQDVCGGTIAPC
jgi:hypothetical protein